MCHVVCSDVNKTFFVKIKTKTKTLGLKTKTSIFFQDQDFLVKTKTKTLPGPLNRLPYHGHKMNKTVYTRHA